MNKLMCAVSSAALAAASMLGSSVMPVGAVVNGNVSESIFSLMSDGKHEITVEPGDTVPVALYFPQSNGVQQILLHFAIGLDGNLNDTLGKGSVIDREGNVIENFESAFGYYGIQMVPHSQSSAAESPFYPDPACLDSGIMKKDPAAAGFVDSGSYAFFTPNAWNMLYIAREALMNGVNQDSYDAWKAAGGDRGKDFDYENYVPVTKWTKDEAWAYDTPLAEFDLVLPEDLPHGTYVLDVYREPLYNNHPSSLFNDDNELRDKSEWGIFNSEVFGIDDDALENLKRQFSVEHLTIHVGQPGKPRLQDLKPTRLPVMTTPLTGEEKFGDIDCSGEISVNDVVLLNRYLCRSVELTKLGMLNSDCERDGRIDANDSTKMNQFVTSQITEDALGKLSE